MIDDVSDIAAHPGEFRGYFALASEIPPLHEAIGFETVLLAGVNQPSRPMTFP